MVKINKIINTRIKKLNESNKTFEDIFNIIHQDEKFTFCESTDGYRIKKMSYKEIKEKSILCGKYFKNTFSEKNCFVGLMMENSPLWIASFWGLLMAGYKPMLLNSRLGNKLNQEIINMLDIENVILDNDYSFNCKMININDINLDIYKDEICEFEWANEVALSTSATTLNVKVCVYNGLNFSSQILNTKHIVKNNNLIKKHYKDEIKIMALLPFYHIFGLMASYFWLCFFGRTMVFLKDMSSDTVLKTAKKHKVTHIFAVPMVWNAISKEIQKEISVKDEKTKKRFNKGIKLSNKLQNIFPNLGISITKKLMKEVQQKLFGDSIKFLISGGGYISTSTIELINSIGYPLFNGYGMSEIGITSVELRKKIKYRNLSTIGKPFPSIQYKIENDVLYVKGDSICCEIITKQGKQIIDHNEWFCTNDVATIDNKGYYYILGRNDDVVVSSNGEKINPDLIEKNINLLEVRRFCVLGLENEGINKLSLVVEISKDITKLKVKKIFEEIDIKMQEAKNSGFNIEQIYFTNGAIAAETAIKVSRSLLKKKIDNKEIELIPYNNFKNFNIIDEKIIKDEIYNEILNIFSNVLNKPKEEITVNDHFIFDLGGSSLEYLTLLIELEKKFEINFNFTNGENCYTVYEIFNYIIKRGK